MVQHSTRPTCRTITTSFTFYRFWNRRATLTIATFSPDGAESALSDKNTKPGHGQETNASSNTTTSCTPSHTAEVTESFR